MKRLFAAIVVSVSFVSIGFAQTGEINVIPRPARSKLGPGSFVIDRNTRIVATDEDGRTNARRLSAFLKTEFGLNLRQTSKPPSSNWIEFLPEVAPGDLAIDPEAYALAIDPRRIQIRGREQGMFYGMQTLSQLIRPFSKVTLRVPALAIYDSPRFRYRGMHLDVSRHFQPVEFVKKFIDQMALYKFNTFHWHLTDDQGWRIEIKKWPKLTTVGANRPETMVDRNFSPYIGDGIPHGGFYTQEQIKDVVAYANERYITVIPEIELPGHASAAIAAYPQLGCKTDYQYKIQTTWGIFKETFCPTDETFKFLEDVLDETIKLFPDSPYIHIGGDEVLKDHWKESAFVQDLMKRENLKDEHEVQSYFIRRIEKFVNSKGKKIIGWDEILDGGLAPNATVMSWRGMRGGIAAAKAKHDVIMTPTDFVYFDYGQGDPAYEPLNIGNYVPLSKVYSFEPVPPELTAEEAKYVIGGQANIWTEYMKTPQHIEYMAFPRMLALSEVLWSKKEDRDFADFELRLWAHLPRLDKQNVNYRIPEPGGLQNVVTESDRVSLELRLGPGTRIHYTTDGSTPDERSPAYTRPIEVRLGEGEVKTLKTTVILPTGRKSVVYSATIVRGKYLVPVAIDDAKPGLQYQLFNSANYPMQSFLGSTRSLRLDQTGRNFDLKEPFRIEYAAAIRIPADGLYEFELDSTWNSQMRIGSEAMKIDGAALIEISGTHSRSSKKAVVPLRAGYHRIRLVYDHRGGDSSFRFRWGIKGRGLTQAWGGEFVH